MVESVAQARACVDLMKYPPVGRRGVSYCRPHSLFQPPTEGRFTDEANDNTLLVLQIETAKGLEHVDEIAAVPGGDVVFVGNADLAQSLGCTDCLDRGQLRDAMEQILKTATAHKIAGGANVTNPDLIAELHQCGLRFVTLTTDVELFLSGLQTAIKPPRAWATEANLNAP